VTKPAADPKAPQLGTRGRRLWKQYADDGAVLKPAERVLLEEACRTADRLDTLDRILRGDEGVWLRFRSLNDDGSIVSVVINNALAEARQQQVALKTLLAELRASRTAGKSGAGSQPPADGEKEGRKGVLGLVPQIGAIQRQAAG
jgi:hypothetical protein